ncbi:MAG: peptide/nickel transport system permease protein [Actinomycetota bacterium]|nr:peptide/nickel transport system permease protein [Actinomycetota bacterium]
MTDVDRNPPSVTQAADTAAEASSTTGQGLSDKPLTLKRLAWNRFRRHKLAMAGTTILLVIVVLCVFAPLFTKHGPFFQYRYSYPDGPIIRFIHPGHGHWFGGDHAGYDQWTRVLYGGRISLAVGFSVAFFSTILGTVVGVVAGHYGGWIDNFMMRVTDLFLAVPLLVLLIIGTQLPARNAWAATLMGPSHSMRAVITLLTLFFWMPIARVVRGMCLSLKEKEFIEAARASGASGPRIMALHLVPNCTGQIIVSATLAVAVAILTEAVLSFLGFGVDAVTSVTWGSILNGAQGATDFAPYLTWFPGLAIVITVLSVNFVGDGLRDALDPKQTRIG